MMEFDEIVVKESPGLCRCCLSEGCYKDLGTEYTWMNETEVYADMLLECFDISITQHNEGPNGPNRLICEVCITRLRDACNFKKQVMDSEKKFIDMMGRGEFRPKMLIYQAHLKCEGPAAVEEPDDADVEYLEDDLDFGDVDLKDELIQPSVSDVTVAALPIKGKRGRPRKNTPMKPDKRAKVAKVDDKAKSSKAVAKDKTIEIRVELRRIFTIIIEHSTIMPFKWYLNRYRCFYCNETFIDCSKLKEHAKKHDEVKLNMILKRIGCHSRIKWDISEISCKLCPKSIQNFDHFLKHLSDAHDLIIDRDVFDKYCYIFSLSDDGMVCIECCESFKFFGPLLRHVNKYHNNAQKYICDYCGLAFTLKGTIKHHIRNVHTNLKTTCTFCGKNFESKVCLANHSRKEHKTGKFPCDMCPETFESRYLRTCHIALGHNVKSLQFPCEKCPKIFTRKSTLSKHVSVVHLKEFTTCHLCGHKGYDIQAMKHHMNTVHNHVKQIHGIKSCNYCKETFRTQYDLKNHVDTVHRTDKFQCPMCPEILANRYLKKRHMALVHDCKSAQLVCEYCSKIFTRNNKYVQHKLRVHDKVKNCTCDVCGHKTFNEECLKRHMVVHYDARPFKCGVCDKAFRRKKTLACHLKTHRTDKTAVDVVVAGT